MVSVGAIGLVWVLSGLIMMIIDHIRVQRFSVGCPNFHVIEYDM